MEKVWLKQYPKGIPPEANLNEYSSLKHVLEESVRRFGPLTAYSNMGGQQKAWAEEFKAKYNDDITTYQPARIFEALVKSGAAWSPRNMPLPSMRKDLSSLVLPANGGFSWAIESVLIVS